MGERYFQLGRADTKESALGTRRQSSVRKMSQSALNSAPPETGQVIRTALPDDWNGIRYEIGKMVNYVKQAAKDPFMIAHTGAIVDRYSQAAASMNGNSLAGIDPRSLALEAIEGWCRRHYAYVNDPPNIEVIQTPKRMVKQTMIPAVVTREVMAPIFEAMTVALGPSVADYEVPGMTAGDCDEGSTVMNGLSAAWNGNPGHAELAAADKLQIRPIRFRFGGNGGTLHHVWSRPYLGEHGIDCDLTEPGYSLGDFSKFEQFEEVEVDL